MIPNICEALRNEIANRTRAQVVVLSNSKLSIYARTMNYFLTLEHDQIIMYQNNLVYGNAEKTTLYYEDPEFIDTLINLINANDQ